MRRIYPSARDKILDATERVILRDGPSGVTVDAVLAESGMSKGGFFHHFATKTALLGGLLERLSRAIASMAAPSMRGDRRPRGRALRAQIAVAFDLPPAERERNRALVLAFVAGIMECPPLAVHARKANRQTLATSRAEGVDTGTALLIQLALDGYLLAESFKTIKLDGAERSALRSALLALLEPKPRRPTRGPSKKGGHR